MTSVSAQQRPSRPQPPPPLCFVSHAWANGGHAFAVEMCAQLRQRGIKPWLDEEQILPGSSVGHSFRDAVLRKCEVFVALVGTDWHASQSCQEELRCALERRKQDGLQIIPVHWQRQNQRAPALGDTCYIRLMNLSNAAGIDRLAAAVRRGALVVRLVRTLREGPLRERHEAAQMLSRVAEPSTLPFLCRSLTEDHDPLTRYWSAIAVGNIGTRMGCAALRNAAKTEAHAFVREGIQDALERGCRDGNA